MSKSSGALGSLKLSLDVSDQYGKDASEGITVPDNYEEVTIAVNEEGKWEETKKNSQSPCKKDIKARADELAFYEGAIENLKAVAASADQKLFNTIDSINQKKQEILRTIDEAIIAGCGFTTNVGVASVFVNGKNVILGVTTASEVVEDYAYINEYSQMSGTGTNPFKDENKSTLKQSNLGDGFETGYEINGGVGIGTFRRLTGFSGGIFPSQNNGCEKAVGIVSSLAADIDSLRSSIDNNLISDTNAVKEEKTDYELFAWSYKHTDKRIAERKSETQNVINIIDNQSEFQ